MNTQTPLIGTNGLPYFQLGGETALSTHEAGHYKVAMDWVSDEPAIVIWTGLPNSGAFAICLSSAGKYAEPDGTPNREGVRELLHSLEFLGRPQNQAELSQLLDVVMRYMPDLLRMKPPPREIRLEAAGAPVIEITEKTQDGQTIREVAL